MTRFVFSMYVECGWLF